MVECANEGLQDGFQQTQPLPQVRLMVQGLQEPGVLVEQCVPDVHEVVGVECLGRHQVEHVAEDYRHVLARLRGVHGSWSRLACVCVLVVGVCVGKKMSVCLKALGEKIKASKKMLTPFPFFDHGGGSPQFSIFDNSCCINSMSVEKKS